MKWQFIHFTSLLSLDQSHKVSIIQKPQPPMEYGQSNIIEKKYEELMLHNLL